MKNRSLTQWATAIEPFRRAIDGGKRVLSLDPSSSCTGIAIHDCSGPPRLVYADRLRSKPVSLPAYERIDQVAGRLPGLIKSYDVDYAVVEVTTGKTSSRHTGHGAGLAVYGVAVGAMRQALRQALGGVNVLDVLENEWTARTSKLDRWHWCRSNYPSYVELWDKDKITARGDGGDASDATYLFDWCRQMAHYTRSAGV